MMNKVILSGTVDQLKVVFDADAKPQTSFTLRDEQGYGEGKIAKLFIPVAVAPSRSETVADAISDGAVVLINGGFKWRSWTDKTGKRADAGRASQPRKERATASLPLRGGDTPAEEE